MKAVSYKTAARLELTNQVWSTWMMRAKHRLDGETIELLHDDWIKGRVDLLVVRGDTVPHDDANDKEE